MGESKRYTVRVKPGSKKGPLVETSEDGSLIVFVRERAVDGAANEAVIALLSKHWDVPKSAITLENGHGSRVKRFSVDR